MEQYVKGFQRFHAGEDVRPVTSCKLNTYYCYCRCCCCRWWHLLLGLLVLRPSISSLLQSATSVITKCDSFFYYKVRWSVITKCDSFFITKCGKCYNKVRQVLQSATIITKCDRTYVNHTKWKIKKQRLLWHKCHNKSFNYSWSFTR